MDDSICILNDRSDEHCLKIKLEFYQPYLNSKPVDLNILYESYLEWFLKKYFNGCFNGPGFCKFALTLTISNKKELSSIYCKWIFYFKKLPFILKYTDGKFNQSKMIIDWKW